VRLVHRIIDFASSLCCNHKICFVKELSEHVDPATFACGHSCFALDPYKSNSLQARHTSDFAASATMDETNVRSNTVIRTCSLFASFVLVRTLIYESVTRS
jgi:hypothetical protein